MSDNIISGRTAGSLLLYIYFMSIKGIEEPSLRKAIYICIQEHKNYSDTVKKRFPISEPSIRKYWDTHKTVSHYWAALLLLGHKKKPDADIVKNYLFGKDISILLSIADKLREFGEEFTSSRNKNALTLLNPQDTWNIPDNITLSNVDFNIEELPDVMQDALKQYSYRNYY